MLRNTERYEPFEPDTVNTDDREVHSQADTFPTYIYGEPSVY